MTEKKHSSRLREVKALLAEQPDIMKVLVKEALQEVLDAEMSEFLGADRNERSTERNGYRAGYYSRGLVTRIGKLELRVLARTETPPFSSTWRRKLFRPISTVSEEKLDNISRSSTE